MGLAKLVRLNALLVGLKLNEFQEFTDRIVTSTFELKETGKDSVLVQTGIDELVNDLSTYKNGLEKTKEKIREEESARCPCHREGDSPFRREEISAAGDIRHDPRVRRGRRAARRAVGARRAVARGGRPAHRGPAPAPR